MYIFSSTECADGATSYYKEFTYNNKRVIISNNVRIYVHTLHKLINSMMLIICVLDAIASPYSTDNFKTNFSYQLIS